MGLLAADELRLARLTVDQVHAMVDAGILREGEAIELIDGVLICKDRSTLGEDPMTIGKRHNLVVKLLARLDGDLVARGYHMQTQGPLQLSAYDEPEPDAVILRGDPRSYADRLPGSADAETVIEVADSSLEHDRTTKLVLYARAGIGQYVIVNLRDACVEVHERPQREAGRYSDVAVVHAGQLVPFRVGDERLSVDAALILP